MVIQVAQNEVWGYNLGYFDACEIFILYLGIFAIFFRSLGHPGAPGGVLGASGGPPQGGTPHGYLPAIILIFYISGIS